MERNIILTKQITTFHLKWTHWTQKRPRIYVDSAIANKKKIINSHNHSRIKKPDYIYLSEILYNDISHLFLIHNESFCHWLVIGIASDQINWNVKFFTTNVIYSILFLFVLILSFVHNVAFVCGLPILDYNAIII